MHFEWSNVDRLTPGFVAHWRALGLATSSPNIYLMPEFVLPAIRHLETDKSPRVAALWNADRSALVALGIFNALAPTWRFPFARLSTLRSIHSFQSGVLLRDDVEPQAVDRFVGELFGGSWSAVRLAEVREDSIVFRRLQESAHRRGLTWIVDRHYQRALLKPKDREHWRDHISGARHRRLRRAMARLADLGTVKFRVVQGGEVSSHTVEEFLRVEQMGWKSATALMATSEGTRFFRDVTQACNEHGLMFFCELMLNDKVIASTSNFQINGCGFAFKIGSDPTYAKLSPGILVEYAFLESVAETMPRLQEIDSGSQSGSFIEWLWPERIPIVSGHLLAGALPAAYAKLKRHLKSARQLVARKPASA